MKLVKFFKPIQIFKCIHYVYLKNKKICLPVRNVKHNWRQTEAYCFSSNQYVTVFIHMWEQWAGIYCSWGKFASPTPPHFAIALARPASHVAHSVFGSTSTVMVYNAAGWAGVGSTPLCLHDMIACQY